MLAVGTAAWIVATVVVLAADWDGALSICATGVALGAVGYGLFWLQRRGARRGDKTAQRGLT